MIFRFDAAQAAVCALCFALLLFFALFLFFHRKHP